MTTRTEADAVESSSAIDSSAAPSARGRRQGGNVDVAGVSVANLTEGQTIARIEELINAGGGHYMVVVNASKAVLANGDPKLLGIIANADLVTADGISVILASKLLGRGLKERVTGIDVFEKLLGRAERTGLAVYLLGASGDSVGGLVSRVAASHPNLRLAGFRNGYFDPSESAAIADGIRRSGADLLFVAMGSPAQEYWIAENILSTGVKFALGVGGAFDHLSGRSRRAPRWMQRAGLEWLYRLLSEPRRLWRRYLVGNTKFIWLIVRQIFSRIPTRPD